MTPKLICLGTALSLVNCATQDVEPFSAGGTGAQALGGASGAAAGAGGSSSAGVSGAGQSAAGGGGPATGGAGAGGTTGGASAAAAGTPSAGSGGSSGASASGAGGAAGGTDGGAGSGAGGSSGASFGGAGAGAGASGAAGQGGQAGAGSGGAPESDRMVADVIDGFAILKPCVSSFQPSMNANNNGDCCCEELAANENQRITKQLGGDPTVTYNVTLRVAGVAERYWYSGGTLDQASGIFYAGGLPTIHGPAPNNNLQPGQGACKIHPPETNGFNIFALTVSSPKKSYYLNHTTDFDNVDRQPHSVYETDYTVTIPIQGQAQLDFYTIDGDHHQVTNNGTMTVPDVDTMQPYNGNFLEFSVVDVTRAN
jgi:hypothetical protein